MINRVFWSVGACDVQKHSLQDACRHVWDVLRAKSAVLVWEGRGVFAPTVEGVGTRPSLHGRRLICAILLQGEYTLGLGQAAETSL